MDRFRVFSRAVMLPVIGAGLLLAAYATAYWCLGSRSANSHVECILFRYSWQTYLFVPAATVESFVRQKEVSVATQNRWQD
jgi:hypothetical protein